MCSQMHGRATVEGFCLVQAGPSLPVFIGSNQTGGNNAWSSPIMQVQETIMLQHLFRYQGTFDQFPALGKIILLAICGCVCLGEGG